MSVDFLFPPSPLIQAGKPRLVYEMRVTNYVPLTYTLDAIEVHAGSKTFSYAGATLRQMTRFLGEKAQTAATLKFLPGQSAICMSSEPFGQVRERIKRESDPSGLKLRLSPDGAAAV